MNWNQHVTERFPFTPLSSISALFVDIQHTFTLPRFCVHTAHVNETKKIRYRRFPQLPSCETSMPLVLLT